LEIVLQRQNAHADAVAGLSHCLIYAERLSQWDRLDCRFS